MWRRGGRSSPPIACKEGTNLGCLPPGLKPIACRDAAPTIYWEAWPWGFYSPIYLLRIYPLGFLDGGVFIVLFNDGPVPFPTHVNQPFCWRLTQLSISPLVFGIPLQLAKSLCLRRMSCRCTSLTYCCFIHQTHNPSSCQILHALSTMGAI